jgi:hypothetical protein
VLHPTLRTHAREHTQHMHATHKRTRTIEFTADTHLYVFVHNLRNHFHRIACRFGVVSFAIPE